jgi:hypothetical protein
MRRHLAPTLLVLLLAPQALAQTTAPPQPPRPPTPAAIEAQVGAQASFEASYLLVLYMAALANAGNPPSPADVDEATRQYFTNGAAVTGVPASGPGAAYFQNGAEVTSIPSSGPGAAYFHSGAELLAYRSPWVAGSPVSTGPPGGEADAGTTASTSATEDAGEADAAENAETAPAQAVPATEGTSAGPGMALEGPATTNAQTATPSPAATSCAPCLTSSREAARANPARAAEAATACPAGPSPFARVATALGGALCGALAVALWSRPRPPRRERAGKLRANAK